MREEDYARAIQVLASWWSNAATTFSAHDVLAMVKLRLWLHNETNENLYEARA